MSERKSPDAALLEFPEERPIILAGEPRALRGRARIRNAGQEKIALREAWVRPAAKERNLDPAPAAQLSIGGTLQPGQEQQLSLTADLDPGTPPGEYLAELEVAGRRQPVVLQVVESIRLQISPGTLVIDQPSGSTVRKRVVFANEGNVPLTIGPIDTVRLAVELPPGYATRSRPASSHAQARSLGSLVEQLGGGHPRRVMRQVADMVVRHEATPLVLQPGDVQASELVIEVPETLEANRRYYGRTPLYTSDLEFVVVPPATVSPPRPDKDEAAERPKPPKKRSSAS